jgi:beta-glucosidase
MMTQATTPHKPHKSSRRAMAGLLATLSLAFTLGACDVSDPTDRRAQALLERMSLEEKVGQVIQGDISTVTPQDAKDFNLGSVLNGGNSAPGGGKTASWQAWVDLADAFWQASTDTTDGGVGIPAIWGTDAVHGHNNLQMAVIFPHNSALGATRDADLLRRIGAVTAKEVKATGLDWVFAPTLAVARDDRWGRAYESYSEDPYLVSQLGEGILQGLQGLPGSDAFLDSAHVVATAKHFVGDGGTQYGIDKGDTIGDLADIKKVHAYPYQAAIANQVQTVMASFSSVNGEKMHGSKTLLTDVLRDDMKFDGFVIGDWNGHAEIPGCTPSNCPESLAAGVDMYMAPDSWKDLYYNLLAQVKDGTIEASRLDEAVLSILRVKIRAGLLDAGLPSQRVGTQRDRIGTADHREVGREAVRKSLVLLKNNDALLPIDPRKNVLVIGQAARSMEQQTGGWTLSWQGDNNANTEFETGETIYAGLKDAVEKAGGTIDWAANADALGDENQPDIIIFVYGETPYAEFKGDMSDTVYEFSDGPNLAILQDLKASNVPVVSVFLTGRPLFVNPHINRSDAFVVAWLPGTQGAGIADVLIQPATSNDSDGAMHDFTGKLSFTWPSDGRGQPIDKTSQDGVQFAFGYGLSYGQSQNLSDLPEDPLLRSASGTFTGQLMNKGEANAPFGFYLGDSSNWKTPAGPFQMSSLGGVVVSRGVDYLAQEDARQLTWQGGALGVAKMLTQRSVDVTALGAVSDLTLSLTYRLDAAASDAVQLGMTCGDNCAAELDIRKHLNAEKLGVWQVLDVPMSCFVDAGLNPSKVQAPWSLQTQGTLSLSLYDIAVKRGGQGSCP